jgi:hypothetical protein
MKIEYKHVRVAYTSLSILSKKHFDKQIMGVLNEHGADGWKLQGVIHEGFLTFHYHMIFMKETE